MKRHPEIRGRQAVLAMLAGAALLSATDRPSRAAEPAGQAAPVAQPAESPSRAAEPAATARDRGWSLGFQFVSDHIGAEDPGPGSPADAVFVDEQGGGVLLSGGYAFTPSFALRLVLAGARHRTTSETADVNHLSTTIEAHVSLLPGRRATPYVFGGVGGATLIFDADDLESKISGGVAVLGVGVLYDFTRHLSLDIAGRLDLVNWNRIEVSRTLPGGGVLRLEDPVDDGGSAGKILVGLGWNF